jgi:hypothetical protein
MTPVVPGASDGKEALVPDHLADDLEADPLEPVGDLGGMHPGVPDVADVRLGTRAKASDQSTRVSPDTVVLRWPFVRPWARPGARVAPSSSMLGSTRR